MPESLRQATPDEAFFTGAWTVGLVPLARALALGRLELETHMVSQFLLVTTLHVHVLAAIFGQTRLDAHEGVASDLPWTACTIPPVTQFQDYVLSLTEFDELVPDTEGDPMFAELDLDFARGWSWSRAVPPAESGIASGGEVETRPSAERDAQGGVIKPEDDQRSHRSQRTGWAAATTCVHTSR